jgi:hypothetical protein
LAQQSGAFRNARSRGSEDVAILSKAVYGNIDKSKKVVYAFAQREDLGFLTPAREWEIYRGRQFR